MTFDIAHAEGFPLELGRAPKKVRNAWSRTTLPVLRESPARADAPRIKRLAGYKDLWRLRVSDDYRLVYRVDVASKVVTLLMLGDRGSVYQRLGANEAGEPGVRIVAKAEELLEREPTAEALGQAALVLDVGLQPQPDNPLPVRLEPELLTEWGITAEHHLALASVELEGDLLDVDVPAEVVERVMNALWPKPIEDVVQQPVRMTPANAALELAADGELDLRSFLLRLDDDQKAFVSRFEVPDPKGPWLLKGGPGSGKSTVALYCVRSLTHNGNGSITPPRILFTTFTKSLVNASQSLLQALGLEKSGAHVEICNVDKLARRHLADEWRKLTIQRDPTEALDTALSEFEEDKAFGFSPADAAFLLEEIDWVIVGQGLRTLEEYLEADRTGRGRGLTRNQKGQVWRLFLAFRNELRKTKSCLFSELLQAASENVTPQYEYVFIDEAQDLKPVAIRFCIALCHDPSRVFLTADTNQSIYGHGLSWTRVASDLRFQGRARILRKNYRTTAEIWDAIAQITSSSEVLDQETLEAETVFHGPFPTCIRYDDEQSLSERLNAYLHQALIEERVGRDCAAVLCSTRKDTYRIAGMIDPRFNPLPMKSSDLDLAHPGVKVLTMHAAKGLQFPVVAIVGLEDGKLPRPLPEGADPIEHLARERRLLFVACSRAARRLAVFARRSRPSQFATVFTDEHWDVEEIA